LEKRRRAPNTVQKSDRFLKELAMCFCAGTRILTPGGPALVERLQIGDLVETLHGGVQRIKWVGRRLYRAAAPQDLPVRIFAGAIDDNVPERDLLVSADHGICIDGALIAAGRLVNNSTIARDVTVQEIGYFHIELEEHEVLVAQNCGAESYRDEGARRQVFENAASFALRYPVPLPWPPVPCLPTLDQGFVLDAIQQRLTERAGLEPLEALEGPLRGFVDEAGPERAAGWAQCEASPEVPVCLDIFVDGVRVMRALANLYRADLRDAGLGSGNHAFSVELPEPTTGVVEVRRTIDQELLPQTDSCRLSVARRQTGPANDA